jgi:hypothetical protein
VDWTGGGTVSDWLAIPLVRPPDAGVFHWHAGDGCPFRVPGRNRYWSGNAFPVSVVISCASCGGRLRSLMVRHIFRGRSFASGREAEAAIRRERDDNCRLRRVGLEDCAVRLPGAGLDGSLDGVTRTGPSPSAVGFPLARAGVRDVGRRAGAVLHGTSIAYDRSRR